VEIVPSFIDLTGKNIGGFVAIRRVKNVGNQTRWLWKCFCGKEFETYPYMIKNGTTKSCGCLSKNKFIDLTGMVFGSWVVLSLTEDRTYWNCRCRCGDIVRVYASNLRGGRTKSCIKCSATFGEENGLVRATKKKHGENYTQKSDEWYGQASGIFARCREKGIPLGFDTAHQLATYLKSIVPNRCPVLGYEMVRKCKGKKSPSVDRIRPELGYVKGNIQIISLKANTMKTDASNEEMEMFARWVIDRPVAGASEGLI
jgi:hypothetical protein